MAYRRRRKFKGTWLPVYGETFFGQTVVGTGLQGNVDADTNGENECIIIPLTPDTPVEDWDETVANNNLADTVGSEWALRRIVGKLLIWRRDPFNADSAPYWCKVGAGFFVARAASEQQSVPIGAGPVIQLGTDDAAWESYSPLAQKATREPWIWRRTWVLQNPTHLEEAGDPSSIVYPTFPASTAGYGSVLDGPHVDAKTRRRIGQDERLWFAIAASVFPYSTGESEPSTEIPLGYDLDIRIFGALRRARGRGAF